MKIGFPIAAAMTVAASLASAQEADLSTIVTESVGYFSVSPGIVIVEGNENQPNRICSITITDDFIAGMATGQKPADGAGYDCFTLEETGNDELSDLIDGSVGYFNIRPGVIAIEGEGSSTICAINVSDTYLAARKISDIQAQADHLPSATCFPLSAIEG